MMSGIRHLVLDTGAGYELKTNKTGAILTIVGSVRPHHPVLGPAAQGRHPRRGKVMGDGTELGRVRGLGSAHEGAHHWWRQRLTAGSNLFFLAWFMISLTRLGGFDYASDPHAGSARPGSRCR